MRCNIQKIIRKNDLKYDQAVKTIHEVDSLITEIQALVEKLLALEQDGVKDTPGMISHTAERLNTIRELVAGPAISKQVDKEYKIGTHVFKQDEYVRSL